MPEHPLSRRPFVLPAEQGWYLLVKVLPGAKRNELCGVEAERLKIRLAAPAVDNKANEALLAFLAGRLRVKKNGLALAAGAKSGKKKIFLSSGCFPDWNGLGEKV